MRHRNRILRESVYLLFGVSLVLNGLVGMLFPKLILKPATILVLAVPSVALFPAFSYLLIQAVKTHLLAGKRAKAVALAALFLFVCLGLAALLSATAIPLPYADHRETARELFLQTLRGKWEIESHG